MQLADQTGLFDNCPEGSPIGLRQRRKRRVVEPDPPRFDDLLCARTEIEVHCSDDQPVCSTGYGPSLKNSAW
jgi:hypothetical protein